MDPCFLFQLHRRLKEDGGQGGVEYVGVDACAANLMRPAIYGAYHHITVMGKEEAPHDHMYDVTGALCENCDKFAVDRMLPEINTGDLLVMPAGTRISS